MSQTNKEHEVVILEEGIEIQHTKAYGIGIDTHSKFIQVSVLVKRQEKFFEYRREFPSDYDSLVAAKEWVCKVVETCSDPVVSLNGTLHFCIESTASYHFPVIKAWSGTPSIVNPSIAGATKRKTDVLDAKLLAIHDLTGVWAESFIPPVDVTELRIMISNRDYYNKVCTGISQRINCNILKFGITFSRDGSVTKTSGVRKKVECLLDDEIPEDSNSSSPTIPVSIRKDFKDAYAEHDHLKEIVDECDKNILKTVQAMQWETEDSTLDGKEMLKLLKTAPGVGDQVAITWLANIITPRRFPNQKALAAYCGLDPSLKISAKHVTSTVKRGGNKKLHHALTTAASTLIKNHSEMFGKWGYNLYLQTSRWKKATNAVARKIAISLYFMQRRGVPFSYDQYKLISNPSVLDISIDQLVVLNSEFKRYIRPLTAANIQSSADLVNKYLNCQLKEIHGLGKKFYGLVNDFINNQAQYRDLYAQHFKDEAFNEKE